MTHKDIYTKFMIEYDKANITSSYPSLTKYEVANLLDKAYLALIAQKVTGNNPRRAGFEADVKSIQDLQPLVKTQVLKEYQDLTIASNESSYLLPNDLLYYSNCQLINDSNAKRDILNVLQSNKSVQLIDHSHADKFKTSTTNFPWLKNPMCYMERNTLHVLVDPKDNISNTDVYVTYIKKPASFTNKLIPAPIDPDFDDDKPENTVVWTYVDHDNTIIQQYKNLIPGTSSNKYIPSDPVRSGYEFLKWFPNIPGTVTQNNIVFKAMYSKDDEPEQDDPIIQSTTVKISVNTVFIDSDNDDKYGYVIGAGMYFKGQPCVLTAVSKEDNYYTYSFSEWSKDGVVVSGEAKYIFTANSNETYTATFIRTTKDNPQPDDPDNPNIQEYWVDLGLPSGTVWASRYSADSNNLMTLTKFPCTHSQIDVLVSGMNNTRYDLPNDRQWKELWHYCNRTNKGFIWTFTGPNGKSIQLFHNSENYFMKNSGDTGTDKLAMFALNSGAVVYNQYDKDWPTGPYNYGLVRPVERQQYHDKNGNLINKQDTTYYIEVVTNDATGTIIGANKSYKWAEIVELKAVPNDGYKFSRWKDNNSTSPIREISAVRDLKLEAIFIPEDSYDYYTVTIKSNNDEFGLAMPSYDNQQVAAGESIDVIVYAKDGYRFVKWSDNQPSTSIEELTQTRRFYIDRNINVTAIFEPIQN